MYRCQQCGDVVPRGVSRQLIIVREPYRHTHRRGVNKKIFMDKGKKVEKWVDDPGGYGTQIVSETAVCLKCMALHNQKVAAAGANIQ